MAIEALHIDLSDLDIDDVEMLMQAGGRGMPDFAASTGEICKAACACSCGDCGGSGGTELPGTDSEQAS